MSEKICQNSEAGNTDGPEINGEDYFQSKYGRLPQIGDIEDGWVYEHCANCGMPGWISARDYHELLFHNVPAYCDDCRDNEVGND